MYVYDAFIQNDAEISACSAWMACQKGNYANYYILTM